MQVMSKKELYRELFAVKFDVAQRRLFYVGRLSVGLRLVEEVLSMIDSRSWYYSPEISGCHRFHSGMG